MNEIAQTGPRPNIFQVRSSDAYGDVVLFRLLAQYSFGRPADTSRNRNEAAYTKAVSSVVRAVLLQVPYSSGACIRPCQIARENLSADRVFRFEKLSRAPHIHAAYLDLFSPAQFNFGHY
ncbi:hypothetical protein ACVMB2_003938 [Sinorhizobium meliloti]